MEDIAENATRVIAMDEGRIVMDDTPEAVFTDVDTLEKYGLRPPEAVRIAEKLREAGIAVDDNAITIRQIADSMLRR